ncbi:MAG TPA: response regulator, partial [Propionibacteriaceae bacterium]
TSLAPVLVVDNDPAKRLAVQATLAPLDCRIVEAESGIGALRCLMQEDFAVILLDVRMPTMNGFETAALIRLRPRSEMTPIIFITAYASDEIATTRYAQGAVDFLFTPFDPDELRAKVSAFVKLFVRAETLAAQARDVQASADQLRLLTEAAPIGIFQTDAENRYVYCNPRWAEITGIAAALAQGQQWDTFIDPTQRASLAANRVDARDDSMELSHRYTISGPAGTSKTVLLTSRSIHDGDGVSTGRVGTLADITSEVGAAAALSEARDQATEASRLKSDFLANMSHEIRTPIHGVLGMTELLLDTDLEPVQRDYARTVRQSGEALLTVVNDILDFSKIESGKLDVEDVRFNVRATTQEVVEALSAAAHKNGLTLVANVDDSVRPTMIGDPGRLRQVLMNLVGNAIKFSKMGQIVVQVTGSGDPGSVSHIRFEVSDPGVGIDPDKLTMIFEPFVQEDTSTTRRYGGTGLGLAISSQLVALMGGEIGVSSELGKGSTFWFTVRNSDTDQPTSAATNHPLEVVDLDQAQERQGEASSPVGGRRCRLLLAEDNLINQKVAVTMLTRDGYDVDTALDGLEAVRATRTRDYDAILMDCQMPELNGYEATAAIRLQEGSARRTPIIGLTAGARPEDRERCMAEDMDDYLSKPFDKGALLRVVREHASAQAAQRHST